MAKKASRSSTASAKSAGKAPTGRAPKRKATAPRKAKASKRSRSLAAIDGDLLKLLAERIAATEADFRIAEDPRTASFDPGLEQQLFNRLRDAAGDAIPSETLQGVWREILAAARGRLSPVRVAYLGPAFSFTHLAALERFGQAADLVPVESITSVFEEVNRGQVDYGVVPIENSTDGRIVDTLEMFTRLPIRICGEVQIPIHHNLLSRSPRSEIVEVYSKPQALSQCRDWLARSLPNVVKRAVASTSTAAELARDKPGAAAVASRQAAVQYGLDIIAENIEDSGSNATRFAIIGDEEPAPTKRDRTALLLHIPHKPGQLAEALACFDRYRINLSWIESFPLRGETEGYQFFLDAEGHRSDAKMKKALADLEKHATRLEVLGSYPRWPRQSA